MADTIKTVEELIIQSDIDILNIVKSRIQHDESTDLTNQSHSLAVIDSVIAELQANLN